MSEAEVNVPVPEVKRRSLLGRLGCGVLLVVWFFVLLTPCFFLTLAFQQEIRVATGGAPGQELRIWLIMEVETRGIGVSNGTVRSASDDSLCVETHINYLLWAGQEDSSLYCECYQRSSADESWSLTTTVTAVCRE